MLQHVRISFFLRLNLLLHVYATFCLSIHLWMDTWVASTFGIGYIMIMGCHYLFVPCFQFRSELFNPEVELLDYMVILCLIFEETPFCSTDLFVYSFTKTSVLITMVLKQVLKSGQVNSPILVFFFNIMYYSTQNYVGYLGDLSLRLH